MRQSLPLFEASLLVPVTDGLFQLSYSELKGTPLKPIYIRALDEYNVRSETPERDRNAEICGIDLQIELAIGANSGTREGKFREQLKSGFAETDLVRATDYHAIFSTSHDMDGVTGYKRPSTFRAGIREASLARPRIAAQDDRATVPADAGRVHVNEVPRPLHNVCEGFEKIIAKVGQFGDGVLRQSCECESGR